MKKTPTLQSRFTSERLSRDRQGKQLAARTQRTDLHGPAPLLAEDRATFYSTGTCQYELVEVVGKWVWITFPSSAYAPSLDPFSLAAATPVCFNHPRQQTFKHHERRQTNDCSLQQRQQTRVVLPGSDPQLRLRRPRSHQENC